MPFISERVLHHRILKRIQLWRGIIGDIHPDVDVWSAAEIPDEGRAFESPVIIYAVIAEVAFLVEREITLIEPALGAKAFHHFVAIGLSERLEQDAEDALQLLLLIGGELVTGQP